MTGTLLGMPSREHNQSEEFNQDPSRQPQDPSPSGEWADMHKLGALTQGSGTSSERSAPRDARDGGLDFKSSGTMIGGTNPLAVTPITPLLRQPRRSVPLRLSPTGLPLENKSARPTSIPATNLRGNRQLLLLLVGIVVAVGLGALVAVMTKESPAVKIVDFAIDAEGRDRLIVQCPSCADGSRIRLEETWSVLEDRQARVHPEEKLAIGPNHLQFQIETLEGRHLDAKAITLPVAFRLTTQWLRPAGRGPEAMVRVEAPLGSRVIINGEEMVLTGGVATKTLLYDAQTTGNAPQIESLSFALDVTVISGDQTQQAKATLRGEICPLVAEVKYGEGDTDPAWVRGMTAPNARLLVAGSQAEIGLDGSFEHRLDAQIRGPITVVASTSELLPRSVVLTPNRNRSVPAPP